MHIKVKVIAKAKENRVEKKYQDTYIVFTKSEAERGEANESVQKLLSEYLHISTHRIHLITGGRNKNKIYEIKKLSFTI